MEMTIRAEAATVFSVMIETRIRHHREVQRHGPQHRLDILLENR